MRRRRVAIDAGFMRRCRKYAGLRAASQVSQRRKHTKKDKSKKWLFILIYFVVHTHIFMFSMRPCDICDGDFL